MKIDNEIKLNFEDVLIVPQRTRTASRANVSLERTFKFYHSPRVWTGVPIMVSNMSCVAGSKMALATKKHHLITCLHKYLKDTEISLLLNQPFGIDYNWVSIGYNEKEINRLHNIINMCGKQPNICIDVPNGYMDVFVEFCAKVRSKFPESIIMAGNVTTSDMVQELITHGGVDIVKTQIGPGCFVAGTKVNTNNGQKPIEKIKIGDMVLTHTGQYQKVIGVKSREENKTIIDLNGIKCTKNHEFYVVHKKDQSNINEDNIHNYAKWISAENLSEDYFLVKVQE